ncbi:MAG: polysaccharide deacetylase family protein [Anaerolineaceae bacterium]|nr:polysaccharide deacetylase family protein [Anaerolineaceae bacterium]
MSRKNFFKRALTGVCLFMILLTPFKEVHAQTPAANGRLQSLPQSSGANFDQLAAGWTKAVEPQPRPSEEQTATLQTPADPEKVIYLTFDDGPDPKWTPQILELMKRYHAVGTFFELGRSAASFPEVVKALAEGGQTIGNHSYNHTDLTTLDYNGFYKEIADTNWAIRNALAGTDGLSSQVTPCIRPPYGAANQQVYSYIGQVGSVAAFWSIDTEDWKGYPPQTILKNLKERLNATTKVVLMHDGGENRENTILGLGLILHDLTLAGYRFEPLCTQSGQIIWH